MKYGNPGADIKYTAALKRASLQILVVYGRTFSVASMVAFPLSSLRRLVVIRILGVMEDGEEEKQG